MQFCNPCQTGTAQDRSGGDTESAQGSQEGFSRKVISSLVKNSVVKKGRHERPFIIGTIIGTVWSLVSSIGVFLVIIPKGVRHGFASLHFPPCIFSAPEAYTEGSCRDSWRNAMSGLRGLHRQSSFQMARGVCQRRVTEFLSVFAHHSI